MRSRTIREGSVGLLILLGLGLLGGLILWIRGFDPTRRGYRFIIEFPNISGMEVGAPVRYRGVSVGQTTAVQPAANAVAVEVEVRPATLVIPKDALIQVIQSGLIGESYVDILPERSLSEAALATAPLATDCDPSLIICSGDRVVGEAGVSFSELVGSMTRFTNLFSDPEIVAEIRTLTRNSASAADGITELSQEMTNLSRSVRQELGQISDATSTTVTSVGQAANSIALTAGQVDELITSNRTAIVTTLDSISQTSRDVQLLVSGISPMLTEFEESELLQNLETLSVNAVEASVNLRSLTEAIGDTENLLLLQQTLDSARATFQNAQKITADLDELTGDPVFRDNLRNLVNGLSNLVAASEQLQERTEFAHALNSAEIALHSTNQQVIELEDLLPMPAMPEETLQSP
ncbi:MlaD family protein [Egbenema bharatensis]|uniref:MlaD family protein n=1 Tax=Egbenema bharatensis TaxID=3463334 RepID=UPI003A881DCA